MTDQQRVALLSVAIHEAAHACTAHLFGDDRPQVRIEAMGTGFMGWCRTSKPITGALRYRLHALAGVTGKTLLRWPDVQAADLFDALQSERVEMTIGDTLAAGDYTVQDVAATLALVGRL